MCDDLNFSQVVVKDLRKYEIINLTLEVVLKYHLLHKFSI